MTGLIFDIKRFARHDGPGIRQTVFFKGCALRCWWCHNPESRREEMEVLPRDIRLDGMLFHEEEPVGRVMTVDDVMAEIRRDVLFYEQSGGGVTFSGGEPLLQFDFLSALLSACRKEGIRTAVDTCGYAPPNMYSEIAGDVDLFLFDLKLIDDEAHRKYTGVSNALILENLRLLTTHGARVYLRIPVVPGISDTDANIAGLIAHIETLPQLARVDLLPYHRSAESKYTRLGIENPGADIEPPSTIRMEELRDRFAAHGWTVTTGG